ncbi:hypothetical protein PR202_ga06412 [Eleusine coracana subsp. coracana]|uniref:Uncharacterized protein n=1 Tax=Eleusine coracana subsp. coracana TaxID=191504 RepID=A0AAV5BW41_ELECO|nr:hypothetical protein PR202_ga06412 [Eleusine coracana subsp. coracana]
MDGGRREERTVMGKGAPLIPEAAARLCSLLLCAAPTLVPLRDTIELVAGLAPCDCILQHDTGQSMRTLPGGETRNRRGLRRPEAVNDGPYVSLVDPS